MKRKTLNEAQFREYLKRITDEAGGARPWAESRRPKVAHSYVSAVISGEKSPGKKILKAAKAKLVRLYDVPVIWFEDID